MKKKYLLFYGLLSANILALLGCSGTTEPEPKGPRVEITTIFASGVNVNSNRLDWSPDGQSICFEASDMNLYRVAASAGSPPVRVTLRNTTTWDSGGEAGSYLNDGRLAFYSDPFSDAVDKDMRIMAASSQTVNYSPAPTVLRQFNGYLVGVGQDLAKSPQGLSISGDGTKAAILWSLDSVYLLTWSVTPSSVEKLGIAVDAVISRDGNTVAILAGDGIITVRPWIGGASTTVGAGSFISFGDRGKLGYVGEGGYVVYDIETGAKKIYTVPAGAYLQNAALSWDASKVAFRTFGTSDMGISIGILTE